MENAMQIILTVITTAMTGFVGLLFHKLKKHEEKREIIAQERLNQVALREKAVSDALRALCRDRILQGFTFYKQRGGITTHELETMDKLYDAYHTLGGNGTITSVFEQIKRLPIKEEGEE